MFQAQKRQDIICKKHYHKININFGKLEGRTTMSLWKCLCKEQQNQCCSMGIYKVILQRNQSFQMDDLFYEG